MSERKGNGAYFIVKIAIFGIIARVAIPYSRYKNILLFQMRHATQVHIVGITSLVVSALYAESAQAKVRIERLWGTFQDRLIAEPELRKIKTMIEATQYLNEEFLPYWNKTFIVKLSSLKSIYQKAPSQENWKEILALKFKRKIINDETIHWKNHLYRSTHKFGYSIVKRSAEDRL